MPDEVIVTGDPYASEEDRQRLSLLGEYQPAHEPFYQSYHVEKMTFAKVRNEQGKLVPDKSTIIYNSHIRLTNIPLAAYEYQVNGKSAIEWVMERYAITTDTASRIVNNPNLYAKEHNAPRYILDLLLSVIYLSLESQQLIAQLPKLNL